MPSPDKCTVAIPYGEATHLYGFTEGHPLGRDRALAFWTRLKERGLADRKEVHIVEPEMAEEEQVLLFHTKEYVRFVRRASERGMGYLDYGDTPAYAGVYEASLYVVGSTLKALRLILEDQVRHAFVPIGGLHHARRDRASGFCVFNDAAIAIEACLRLYGMDRILYVDIDVHHGDGVFYEFYNNPKVHIFDIHEDGRFLYPGTGFPEERGDGEAFGTKLNVPLPPGAGDEEFRKAFAEVTKVAEEARPQVILLQCGADGMAQDPLAHLRYTPQTHSFAAQLLHSLAHRYCDGRLLAMGGGGYDRGATAEAWCNVVEALISSPKGPLS